ncbi:EF-hand domain-containing protein [Candidatus Nitrotoga sp. 1052]|uniref:EF-hand domain-containing protein n=1 Tax=Candidatus Nitrotoga sp. 1052 TaxID=2886964 RepID=UPI001EF61A77|nr:EF-hand domain-containing protein [Candidatus Nitrotoga sp. 1052]CAH1087289.1 EF-hand domain-containing protein [Candidatus Nitrotoga sp. 1052]
MNYSSTLQNKAAQSIALVSMLLIGATGIVQADSITKEDTPSWVAYDTNHDSFVSLEEATTKQMPTQVFKELDANHDGKLSKDEFAKESRQTK